MKIRLNAEEIVHIRDALTTATAYDPTPRLAELVDRELVIVVDTIRSAWWGPWVFYLPDRGLA